MSFDLLKQGDKAPDFSLENYNGEVISLKDFKGKNLLYGFSLKQVLQVELLKDVDSVMNSKILKIQVMKL